jgi:SRSO17 transposase
MTKEDLRAGAKELVAFHQQFAPYFGRVECQRHAFCYLQGLLLAPDRKSVEPMALRFADRNVVPMQRFLTRASWEAADVQRQVRSIAARRLAPSAATTPVGPVLVVDETSFTKKGSHSVGVARQHNGRLGKVDNCQVGVFLAYATPAGSALLDHRLYLPREWVEDPIRRKITRIPDDVVFRTKPQLAGDLIETARANGLPHDWIVADELYGQNGGWLDRLEAMNERYVMEVPVSTTVWTQDPAKAIPPSGGRGRPASRPRRDSVRTVRQAAESLEPSRWRTLQLRDGAKGPLTFEFAAVRIWQVRRRRPGPPSWLLVRRSLEPRPEVKYYVSNGKASVSLESLAQVTGVRWRVEELFADCKGNLGMAEYEARGWASWHHHMALVAVAHLFLTLTRQRFKKRSPRSRCR